MVGTIPAALLGLRGGIERSEVATPRRVRRAKKKKQKNEIRVAETTQPAPNIKQTHTQTGV